MTRFLYPYIAVVIACALYVPGGLVHAQVVTDMHRHLRAMDSIQQWKQGDIDLLEVFTIPEIYLVGATADSLQSLFALGISDPGLPAEVAEKQAFIRAVAMASLQKHSSVKDFFVLYDQLYAEDQHEEGSSKFIHMSRIYSGLAFNTADFTLIDSMTNSFGEKLMLLSYNQRQSDSLVTDSLIIDAHALQIEYSHLKHCEHNLLIEMDFRFQSDSSSTYYKVYQVGSTTEIESIVNRQAFPFQRRIYSYFAPKDTPEVGPTYRTKLYYGLWAAYIEAMITHLASLMPQDGSAALKTVQDTYSKRLRKLTQELQTTEFSGRIRQISTFENDLIVEIENNTP